MNLPHNNMPKDINAVCPVVVKHDEDCCSHADDRHCIHPVYWDHDGVAIYDGVRMRSDQVCCKCRTFIGKPTQ